MLPITARADGSEEKPSGSTPGKLLREIPVSLISLCSRGALVLFLALLPVWAQRYSFRTYAHNGGPWWDAKSFAVSLGGVLVSLVALVWLVQENGHKRREKELAVLVGERTRELHANLADLQMSEARKSAILESALDAIITFDAEGRIKEFNPAAEKMFGCASSAVVGKPMEATLLASPLREGDRGSVGEGEGRADRPLNQRCEVIALRADGSRFPAELAISRAPCEGPAVFTAFLCDLTERKQSERRLDLQYAATRILAEAVTAEDAAQRILEAAGSRLDAALAVLWRVDPASDDLYRAASWYSSASLPGTAFETADGAADPTDPTAELPGKELALRVKTSGQVCCFSAGEEAPGYLARATALFPGSGLAAPISFKKEVMGVMEFFALGSRKVSDDWIDIIDSIAKQTGQFFARRDAERELLRAREEAEAANHARIQAQKLESIGQLAAGIAHEINTPIQYVGDNVRFLQTAFQDILKRTMAYEEFVARVEDRLLGDEALDELNEVRARIDLEYLRTEAPLAIEQSLEGVSRVAAIVRATKEFSHPGPRAKAATDINHAIRNTVLVSNNEWKYVADVVEDFDSELPLVPCLTGEMNQVVLNLIVNAAHAIEDVVKDRPGSKGTITIRTRRDGDWVEIEVRDTGSGIPESCQPHIFNLFFTTKEIGRGTGQGLAFVYSSVVQKHQGKVFFETEVGRGTAFIIRLPLSVSLEEAA